MKVYFKAALVKIGTFGLILTTVPLITYFSGWALVVGNKRFSQTMNSLAQHKSTRWLVYYLAYVMAYTKHYPWEVFSYLFCSIMLWNLAISLIV